MLDTHRVIKLLAISSLYNLLSKIFNGDIKAVNDPELWIELRQAVKTLSCNDLEQGLASIEKLAGEYSQDELMLEYTRLFVKGEGKPYETSYLSNPYGKNFELADISGFYKAFGVKPKQDLPDYISCELEFMSLLCFKESYAIAYSLLNEAEICREAQKRFLHHHLCRWLKDFNSHISSCSKVELYPKLVAFTRDLVKYHATELGLEMSGI